jgi:hypothetical protein
MRSSSEVARSSRGRTIIRMEAAIAGAASRRGKGNRTRGSRIGRGVSIAPRGGRGARRGRGAALAARGGRGAAMAPRVRRLQYIDDEALEYDGEGDDDEDDGVEEDDGAEQDDEDDGAERVDEDGGVEQADEAHGAEQADEENENEAQENGEEEEEGGEQPPLYLRGPATLPAFLATHNEKTVIEPVGDS